MQQMLRSLLVAACLSAGAAGAAVAAEFAAPTGEPLLTVGGTIRATNDGATLKLDRDQLASLPQTTFTTSTTWTSGTPTFTGVLLKDLVEAVGASGTTITLTAANDYAITMPMADIGDDAPLLATLVDGQPMSLRDKGPVWMVYPYDAKAGYRTEETFARSIWQLTTIGFSD